MGGMSQTNAQSTFKFQPYLMLLTTALLFVGGWTLFRIWLLVIHAELIGSTSELNQLMWWGLRMDLQTAAIMIAPAVIATALLHHRPTWRVWRHFIATYVAAIAGLALMLEIATPDFMAEYGVRPNRLFFEYLENAREVLSMLLASRAAIVLGGSALVITAIVGVFWQMRQLTARTSPHSPATIAWFLPVLVLCLAFARGTTGHRALNPASAAVTSSQTLNDIALNSLYSIGYAIYALKNEEGLDTQYGDMTPEHALAIVKADMQHIQTEDFTKQASTHHRQTVASERRYKNFVLILEESLGAEFVGSLGGLPVTPSLDALAGQGWWFENMFATGTRSVRGIEAVTTGFLPSPARSVVKLPGAQQGFYTIARTLGVAGWQTHFVYGGDANFDNMRRFLSNNGFQHVTEERNFDSNLYRSTWGVADEYLLDRVHDMLAEPQSEQPQFIFAFTSTNHEPFDYPEGRIEHFAEPAGRVENAVKYADWALGQFFEKAQSADYWDDTLFLVVADHNSRVYGDSLVPVERFRIPALFLGGPVPAKIQTQVASQLDLPVTALSMLGVPSVHPMVGRDLTESYDAGRAIMQFRDNQAFMEDHELVVLRPDLAPTTWRWTGTTLIPAPDNPLLTKRALAHATWAQHAYTTKKYGPIESTGAIPAMIGTAN
jgi:phosphoglycerol transferase MdoB-like AlkP superfamily enzyme